MPGARGFSSVETAPPAAFHAEKSPSNTCTLACPTQRNIHHSRAANMPPWASYATTCVCSEMPQRRKVAINTSISGKGWRPLNSPFGPDLEPARSVSMEANWALGICAAAKAARPASGFIKSCRQSRITKSALSELLARRLISREAEIRQSLIGAPIFQWLLDRFR